MWSVLAIAVCAGAIDSGQPLWTFTPPSAQDAKFVLALPSGPLLAASLTAVYCVDGQSGKLLWHRPAELVLGKIQLLECHQAANVARYVLA